MMRKVALLVGVCIVIVLFPTLARIARQEIPFGANTGIVGKEIPESPRCALEKAEQLNHKDDQQALWICSSFDEERIRELGSSARIRLLFLQVSILVRHTRGAEAIGLTKRLIDLSHENRIPTEVLCNYLAISSLATRQAQHYDQAIRYLDEAIFLRAQLPKYGRCEFDLGTYNMEYAKALTGLNRLPEASAHLERAICHFQREGRVTQRHVILSQLLLANSLFAQKKRKEALDQFRKATEMLPKEFDKDVFDANFDDELKLARQSANASE